MGHSQDPRTAVPTLLHPNLSYTIPNISLILKLFIPSQFGGRMSIRVATRMVCLCIVAVSWEEHCSAYELLPFSPWKNHTAYCILLGFDVIEQHSAVQIWSRGTKMLHGLNSDWVILTNEQTASSGSRLCFKVIYQLRFVFRIPLHLTLWNLSITLSFPIPS